MSNYQWIDIGSETQLQTVQNATNCCIVYYFSQITIDPLITEWLDEMNFSYAKVNIMKFRHLVKFELDALPCFQLYSLSNNIYKPLIQIDLDQVKRLTSMHISITSKLKFTNQSKKLNDWLEADETLLIYYFGIENELHLNRLLKLHILSTKYDFPFVAVDTKSMLLKEHLTERQINKTPYFVFQTSGKSNQIEFKDILTQLQEFDTNDIELSQLFTNSFDKGEKQKGITKKMTVKRVIQSDQIDIQSTGLKIPPKLNNLKTWNESETMEDFNQMIAQKLSCILYYETREESIVEPFIGLMLNYGIPTLSINVLKFDIKSFGNVRYATLPVVQIFQFGKTVGQVVSAKDLDLIKTDILEIYPKYSKLRFITKPVTMTSLIELNKFVLVLYFKPTSEEYKTMLENMQILSFNYDQSVTFLLVNCDNLALEVIG
ncbi:hypothetical protein BC833DRAFT_595244 [Globomyces pollinis-pini]|nr:hypothetical protein BC833DRAFT_595244 [Globomyces pollinis-pini]